MTATVETLVEGLGLRLNGAPIGFCAVVLITSASGHRTLVDTGSHPTRDVVLTALRERRLEPADIDTVVLTHLHFDHCENAAIFRNSRVIVHQAEIEEAELHPTRDRYLADFWRELLDVCQPEVMTGPTLALDEDVTVHHLPGHRHGQLGVLANTAEGRIVCASDVAKNARELLQGEPVLSDPSMRTAARASVAWLLEHADFVIPGHDRRLHVADGVPKWNRDLEIATTIY